MKQHGVILSLILLISTALALVACGGSSASEPAPPTATLFATPVATADTAVPPTIEVTPTVALPVASTAAFPTEELPVVRFTASDGIEVLLPVEVPPRREYSIGLSGRQELEGRGMLFYYPSGAHTGWFWMRNTLLDLDIAFVTVELEVLAILRMEAESLDHHSPGQPYLAAIEAPAGWFEERGIGAGARVELLFDIEDYLD